VASLPVASTMVMHHSIGALRFESTPAVQPGSPLRDRS
jgi:hypothetical protein